VLNAKELSMAQFEENDIGRIAVYRPKNDTFLSVEVVQIFSSIQVMPLGLLFCSKMIF